MYLPRGMSIILLLPRLKRHDRLRAGLQVLELDHAVWVPGFQELCALQRDILPVAMGTHFRLGDIGTVCGESGGDAVWDEYLSPKQCEREDRYMPPQAPPPCRDRPLFRLLGRLHKPNLCTVVSPREMLPTPVGLLRRRFAIAARSSAICDPRLWIEGRCSTSRLRLDRSQVRCASVQGPDNEKSVLLRLRRGAKATKRPGVLSLRSRSGQELAAPKRAEFLPLRSARETGAR